MAKKSETGSSEEGKRSYIRQSDIPRLPLSETLRLARSLYDDFAGKSATPVQLAMAVDVSPTSSAWPLLCGASIAYGLTKGGSKAKKITLLPLGKSIVAPTEEGQDDRAKREAVLKPRIEREFFERYDNAKFPSDKIARNVLAEMGVPQDRLDQTLEVIKRNGEFAGIILQTKTGPYVSIEYAKVPETAETQELAEAIVVEEPEWAEEIPPSRPTPSTVEKQNVFITHGKNKAIVSQLKELLAYGKFKPVVAEEHETTSKPVPDKVLDDMRSCFAGIIHIEGEEELRDQEGNVRHKLNENVLIEIGAALALYGRNVILLVQKGVSLPSNLQGLYRCYYEGEKLDYGATMKLLKAFNEFQ
jgi:predicted nucleotide-binding protein